ncbi:MAG: phosphoesterase RecJ-like protein [Myxococcota bacterium]|jgi:phosphoesterase RecJ-like protein
MQQAIALIQSSKSILLTGHLRADGDCLGAQIVLFYALQALGKEVQIMLPNAPDQRYGFLEQKTSWQVFDGTLPDYDLLIACDCNELARLGDMVPLILERDQPKMVVDHHIMMTPEVWDGAFHDVAAAASGVLAIELAKQLGVEDLPAAAYEAAFVALMTDTGWLKYSNADSRAWEMASYLIAKGVDASKIYDSVYQKLEAGRPLGVAAALQNLQYHADGRLAIAWVTNDLLAECGGSLEDTDEILDLLRAVEQVEAVALLCERDAGQIKISLRSKSLLDVNKVARRLGGGGHARAAGASFDVGVGMPAAVKQTLEVLSDELAQQESN